MNVTTISGINSLGIYYYNNVKYYFFGDIHGQNINNCDNKYHCDYFDYQFTKTHTYNTECTTIGPLLFDWFNYNDNHQIITNFYLEETYDSQTSYDYYYELIKNRKNYNTLSTIFPDNELSWMQLMRYILQDKNYDYVNIHNVDIRFLNHQRVSPFHLNFLSDDKQSNNIIKIMILNYKFILKSLLTTYQLDTLFSFILSKLSGDLKLKYQKQLELMSLMVIDNQHVIARTLNLLPPLLKKNIIDYIFLLSDEHMKYISYSESLDYYIAVFSVLAAYTMDAYVLANMFLNKGDEVIVYAGAAHIEIYHLFFQNYLDCDAIYEFADVDNKCITFRNLPDYININKYRINK